MGLALVAIIVDGPRVTTFADAMRAWLGYRGWTAYRLGKELGGTPSHHNQVRRWLAGDHSPRLQNMQAVAACFEVSLPEFLAGPPAATRRDAGLDAAEAARRMGESADDASQRPPATGEQSA